jgi:hypothetical protein
MSQIRIRRLAAELKMRRRRLDAYRDSPPWPGKDPARRSELIRYDNYLIVAAQMLDVPVPEAPSGLPLVAETRAMLEDRLGEAGLDVFTPHSRGGNILEDGDLNI